MDGETSVTIDNTRIIDIMGQNWFAVTVCYLS